MDEPGRLARHEGAHVRIAFDDGEAQLARAESLELRGRGVPAFFGILSNFIGAKEEDAGGYMNFYACLKRNFSI